MVLNKRDTQGPTWVRCITMRVSANSLVGPHTDLDGARGLRIDQPQLVAVTTHCQRVLLAELRACNRALLRPASLRQRAIAVARRLGTETESPEQDRASPLETDRVHFAVLRPLDTSVVSTPQQSPDSRRLLPDPSAARDDAETTAI